MNTGTEVAPDEANAANAAMPIPVLRIRHLSKTDGKGEVEVRSLKDVNLEMWRSEFIVLLG